MLLQTMLVTNGAMTLAQYSVNGRKSSLQSLLGNPGTAGKCLLDAIDAKHIPPDQFQ